MIKPAELHTLWAAPDNSRLTRKQYSFRLPVHIAAKLAALGDIYPNRTRTELVGDLLTAALDAVEQSLPSEQGNLLHTTPEGEEIFQVLGMRARYWERANIHFRQLERELGNSKPGDLF